MSLKANCRPTNDGYYILDKDVRVPVRIFMNETLFRESEEALYPQIQAATEFPDVRDVVITPDAHTGYVVPVGCVMATEQTLCQAPVGYDIGCFHGDTLIPTADGNAYPIANLASSGDDIYVFALGEDHHVKIARATAKKTRTQASLVEVTLDHGYKIVCTPDHEFMLRDGTYRQAKDLMPSTSLMPFYTRTDRDGYQTVVHPATRREQRVHWVMARQNLLGEIPAFGGQKTIIHHRNFNRRDHRRWQHGYNHKVLSVIPLTETADVYCLTVPEYGNFALDAGVFVHNCGMMAFRSDVKKGKGLDDTLRRRFSEEVMERVAIGVGGGGKYPVDEKKFEEIVRFGATALGYERGSSSERDFIPVDDDWDIPHNPRGRGIGQLRSLGGGNHFIELQYDQEEHLWVMVHTGSRGFGHGMASEFIRRGKAYLESRGIAVRGGAEATYFLPDSPLWREYRNAVAAGGNFAIANRLLIWEGVGSAFQKVFGREPELIYEISHNLVQQEEVPALGGSFWVHRKGATRAFPAGHPSLRGTRWETTGHPILIPGSMGDKSFILYAEPGAEKSLYSVNHGCGRRMSRGAAKKQFSQQFVNNQMAQLNVMVNAGGNVPIDESPGCYKPAEDVIASVVQGGLARVAYTLTPIASIKGND